jgi:hypothetical protein
MQVAFSPNHAEVTDPYTTTEVREARACRSTFLYLFSNGDASLKQAMGQLPDSSPTMRLAVVTVDVEYTNLLLAAESCTQITATYVVGGRAAAGNVDLFSEVADAGDGEDEPMAPPPPPGEEELAEEPKVPEAEKNPEQLWLGSVEDIYEARQTLRDWRGTQVEVEMKTDQRVTGSLVSVQEINFVLSDEGERQYVNMLEAKWIRRVR